MVFGGPGTAVYDAAMSMLRRALLLSIPISMAVYVSTRAAQGPAPGFADPVLGVWDLTVQGTDGAYPSWLEVMLRKETELMGRFVGQFGSNRHVAAITFRDGDLMVRIPVQYEQNPSDLVFTGKLTGDRLEGTTADAQGRTITWTGVRAPQMIRKAPPAWGDPIELVNGRDLTGWKPRTAEHAGCWKVENGALTNTPPCVDLVSERTFTDVKVQAEFSIVPKSNSGIYLRGRYEVQINDDYGKTATDSLRMGGVYGFLRPAENAAGRPGDWQTYEIVLAGRRATVVLNGRTIIDNETIPGITGGALDSNEGAPGPLMLQGDHGKIAFRRITVTPAR